MKTLAIEDRVPRYEIVQSFQTEDPKHKTSTEWAVDSAIEFLLQQGRISETTGTYESEDGRYFGKLLKIEDADVREEITPSIESRFGKDLPYPETWRNENEETTTTEEDSDAPEWPEPEGIAAEIQRRLNEFSQSGSAEEPATGETSDGDSTEETRPRPAPQSGVPGPVPDFDRL